MADSKKGVLVSWKEGDDDGAVLFVDDGPDKASAKADSYVAIELNRYGVKEITISEVKLDDEGHIVSGKSKEKEAE